MTDLRACVRVVLVGERSQQARSVAELIVPRAPFEARDGVWDSGMARELLPMARPHGATRFARLMDWHGDESAMRTWPYYRHWGSYGIAALWMCASERGVVAGHLMRHVKGVALIEPTIAAHSLHVCLSFEELVTLEPARLERRVRAA